MRAGDQRRDRSDDETLEEIRAQPEMNGTRAGWRECRRPSHTLRTRRATCASRSSTTAASARSCRRLAAAGAAVTVYPHDVRRGRAGALRRRRALERPRRPGAAAGRDRAAVERPPRPRAGARHLPRPSAARAGNRPRDVQAALRPPRREPPGARAARRGRVLVTSQNHGFAVREARTTARQRTSRSTTARSKGSTTRSCALARSSSTPKPGPGRTTPGR